MHGVPDSDDIVEMKLYIAGSCVLMAVVLLIYAKAGRHKCISGSICNKHVTVEVWKIALVIPLAVLLVTCLLVPKKAEHLSCTSDRWKPMVPALTLDVYHCILGKAKDARKTLLQEIGPLMLPNILGLQVPQLILPTMEVHISASSLRNRDVFFGLNFFVMFAVVVLVMELTKEISEFIVRPRRFKMTLNDNVIQRGLIQSQQEEAAHEDTQSSEGKTTNRSPPVWKQQLHGILFSIHYIVSNVFLYFLIDIGVFGGFLNIDTGMAWEMWSLGVEFELTVHMVTFVIKTVVSYGSVQQRPSALMLPTFMPLFGNAVHIYKDHLAQGLCFAAAHCSDGRLSYVGLVLGYMSFIATLLPIVLLLKKPNTREGLRVAHWPIFEASTRPFSVPGIESAEPPVHSLASRKREVTNAIITYCTEEKWIRALYGEVPHLFCHVLFSLFFGSSPFMTFAIVLSMGKILSIPALRHFALPYVLEHWHCSYDSARKFLINGGLDDEHLQKCVYTFAKKYRWFDLLWEFFGEYGWVDTQGGVMEICRNDAGQMLLVVNGELQGVISKVTNQDLMLYFDDLGGSEASSMEVVNRVLLFCA